MFWVYGIYVIINIVVWFLQMNVFTYLFGHCNICLSYDISNGAYKGIDFSRHSKVLGTPFDANEATWFIMVNSWIICSIFIILKLKKKLSKLDTTSSKILNILLAILLIGIMAVQGFFLASILMWA